MWAEEPMRVRKRYLPPGWYPATAKQTRDAIEQMLASVRPGPPAACAGVAPHAGWEFSGALALGVFSRIVRSIDSIVIIGGHLGPSDGLLCAFEEGYETPLGTIEADGELLERLREKLDILEDRYADNTVEVQLPFVRAVLPGVKVLAVRASPSRDAEKLGRTLAETSRAIGRRIAVVGSTDLTHYGTNYGFEPAGSGERALKWVRDINDRRLIESLLAMDVDAAIERSLRERSACSVGGAVAAMSFAREMGCAEGKLVKYMTSHEVHPSESFVGYAAIVYPSPGGPDREEASTEK
jgi:AmmeMemoRadiSam system protein B